MKQVLRDLPKAIAGLGVFALVAIVTLVDWVRKK